MTNNENEHLISKKMATDLRKQIISVCGSKGLKDTVNEFCRKEPNCSQDINRMIDVYAGTIMSSLGPLIKDDIHPAYYQSMVSVVSLVVRASIGIGITYEKARLDSDFDTMIKTKSSDQQHSFLDSAMSNGFGYGIDTLNPEPKTPPTPPDEENPFDTGEQNPSDN